MPDKDDLSGRKLGGFVVRERIDEGGFGAVYGCEQPLLGREAVIKVLHRKLRRRDVIVQRFLREAKLASRLDHPYAAHIYAFGIEARDGLLWIAMERVQGVTLAAWLNQHGPMPLGQLVAFFERIAVVVQTAHDRGIVHRDLKPSNVMVIERAGELLPKLLDFGVAKLLDGAVLPEAIPDLTYLTLPPTEALSEKSPASVVRAPGTSTVTDPFAPPPGDPVRLTPDSHIVGSPPYMSPEQWGNAVTVGPASDRADPALLELVHALDRRALSVDERVRLLRLLAGRLTGPRGDHPVPELLELLTPNPGGTDGLDPILALYAATDHAVTEDAVRLQLLRLIPELTELLRRTTFVLDYLLVVPRNRATERWTGRRRQSRALANVVDGEFVQDHPMLLDRAGRVCVDLWPLAQAVPPIDGAEPELFLFDGHGHHGALLIAAPAGLEHHDSITRDWVVAHVIAEIEAKARMREQLRVAAHHWQDRARPDALLWRGEVLAEFERWTRHTTGAAPLGDLDAAFVAASRRVARRSRWIRRLLIAAGVATVLAGIQYRAVMQARLAQGQATLAQQQARMAQQEVTQAEVEEGRQALLHDDLGEAQQHLAEAYRRGDHSSSVAFMLARALQPRFAEQARFTSTKGRMWSAAFSPDGRQIVTTDDAGARVWRAQTSELLFALPHGDSVYDARYSVNGTQIITAGGDGLVRIWSAIDGTLVRAMSYARTEGKKCRYLFAVLSPEDKLIAAIDAQGEVTHVWDAHTGAPLAELHNDTTEVPALAFSADGRWLATSGGNDVRVFDTGTWKRAVTIPGPHVLGLSFDPSGPRLTTGTLGGDASIWEIPSGARVRHLREIGEPVDAVAFAPDGQLVAIADRSGTEQVWNAKSGVLQSQGNYLRGRIRSIEFDATSKFLVAAGASGAVIVSDPLLGMTITTLEGPQSLVMIAHFDPSSRRVVGASWDGTARVWEATSPYRRWSSPPIADDCGLATSLEPDRRFIAVGCRDHLTRVWDTARAQLLAELPSVTPAGGGFGSAFAAVSVYGDRAATRWRSPGGRLLRAIKHSAAVSAVAFAPEGHDLVSGAVDGALLVTRDGREPIVLAVSAGGIDTAGLLLDGRVVAANARDQLRIYDADRGVVLAELEVPTRVRLLRASADGRHLITILATPASQPRRCCGTSSATH